MTLHSATVASAFACAPALPREGERLAEHFRAVRARTVALAVPLSPEDCCAQSMPDASPVKWHLAHTTWFFETFILERHEPGFRPFHAMYRMLFNSYYNGIGDKHPRPLRGMLTRPALDEVLAYRADVDARMLALLAAGDDVALARLTELGLQHEQQHQELIVTDVLHMLSMNPLRPAYDPRWPAPEAAGQNDDWVDVDGGLVAIGHTGDGFCFDNELPRHRQWLEPYRLAARLVSNRDLLRFIGEGGYREPAYWLAEGWDWIRANGIDRPLYWQRDGDRWTEFTARGTVPLDADGPALHLSYYEADAVARWAGARLPTEAEWEHAAASAGARLRGLGGVCWQWTSSSYAPYPGFRIADGAIGEYNGKFMVNQYVLRGGSLATPAGHARLSYRNFFPASARWQFTGVRLAR